MIITRSNNGNSSDASNTNSRNSNSNSKHKSILNNDSSNSWVALLV